MSQNTSSDSGGEMSFIEHLEELRWHILRSLVAIVGISILVFVSSRFIFQYLILAPKDENFLTYRAFCWMSEQLGLGDAMCIKPAPFKLIVTDLPAEFLVDLKVALVLGFVFAFPYVMFQVWKFVKPGLYEEEAKYTRGVVFVTSMLFFTGVLFGYFILSPFSINFFANYSVSPDIEKTITITSYISVITTLVLAAGLMFQLPLVVYFLSKVGVLTPELMRSHRRHALVVILIVAAIITPADVWTQILVSMPVYGLYEISIWVSARVVKKKLKEEAAETRLLEAAEKAALTKNSK